MPTRLFPNSEVIAGIDRVMSEDQGSPSTNLDSQANNWTVTHRFNYELTAPLDSAVIPSSLNVPVQSGNQFGRWRMLYRRNGANIADSGPSQTISSSGVHTATLTLDSLPEWQEGDILAFQVEGDQGGGGGRSFSIAVNNADTHADAELQAAAEPVPAMGGTFQMEFDPSGSLSMPVASVPAMGGSLELTWSPSGSLAQPTASVPTIGGALELEFVTSGSLTIPASSVPTIGGQFEMAFFPQASLSVPTASVLAIGGAFEMTWSPSGSLFNPASEEVPTIGGTFEMEFGSSGSLAVPEAMVPAIGGEFAMIAGWSGSLFVPEASVPVIGGSLELGLVLSGSLRDPAAVSMKRQLRTLLGVG